MIQTELDLTPVHAARISLATQQGNIHHEPSPEIGRTEGRTAHGKRKADTSTEYKTRRWIKFLSPFLPFSVSVRVLQPCRLAEVDQLEPAGRKAEARMMDGDHIHEFHTVQGMQIEHMTLVPNGCVLYCK